MPANSTPLGALPQRFRRQRLLLIGCGDVGLRVLRQLAPRTTVRALTSSPERIDELRAAGVTPLLGNLDEPSSLRRLAGLAHRLLHLAPPPAEGWRDTRTRQLLHALGSRTGPGHWVYASTSGVYGDCAGQKVTEARPVKPHTPRARRRVDAEQQMRQSARQHLARVSLLRVPGIYAPDRPGGTPKYRLTKGTPVLQADDDVYTNHIHADDLARACVAALWRGKPQRVYNVNDDTDLKMGDYFDVAADLYRLPRPPRVARSTAQGELPLMLLSFMSESRRMDNTRLKRELRFKLRYPTIYTGLLAPA